MGVWEIIAIILVSGIVFGFITVVVSAAIGKIIDIKAESRAKVTTNLFRNEMEYLDKILDKYMTRIEKMVDKIADKN